MDHLFDRALYYQHEGNLQSGLEILILGGYRGDDHEGMGQNKSLQFSMKLKMSEVMNGV